MLQIVVTSGPPWKKKVMNVQRRVASYNFSELLRTQHARLTQQALSGMDMYRLPINLNIPGVVDPHHALEMAQSECKMWLNSAGFNASSPMYKNSSLPRP
eukprot:12405692-Karenia_brevis.AAC.1